LADWRGFDSAPLEKGRERAARATGHILPRVLTELRLDRRQTEAEIVRVWNHLIDPALTAHAQPVGLAKGTVFVSVDSHVWLDEIVRYRRREILKRLQHSFGSELVKRLSFRVG
jgi:predicted nucleic acid-binding Zn ribbon protein